ncbi:MAG: hypothetical protein CR971_00690 [candidate division SR1 bacterium]|nr:MAG: hypothetical protein CR971_00690 [candidate division SR1 bacterium]
MFSITYRNNKLEKLAGGIGDYKFPQGIARRYRFVLSELEEMNTIQDILTREGWRAERKKGDRADQIGIRLNDQRRLMIKPQGKTVEILLVWEVSKHYE